jgi:hypothetical protein
MKNITFITLLGLCLFLSACAGTPYTVYSPQSVTDNPIGSKVGEGPLTPTGIQEAANRAGITRIATIDIREVYDGETTTRVYIVSGE